MFGATEDKLTENVPSVSGLPGLPPVYPGNLTPKFSFQDCQHFSKGFSDVAVRETNLLNAGDIGEILGSVFAGIQQIRFANGHIRETFGEVLAVLKREFGS